MAGFVVDERYMVDERHMVGEMKEKTTPPTKLRLENIDEGSVVLRDDAGYYLLEITDDGRLIRYSGLDLAGPYLTDKDGRIRETRGDS